MKREKAQEQKGKGKFVPPPDPLLERLPRLAEAVADLFWDDGAPRHPYTLSVNWECGSCLVQMNDKENERSCATTAPGLSEALMQLETLLASPPLPWRYWRKPRKGKG